MAKRTKEDIEKMSDYEVFSIYTKGRKDTRTMCEHVMFKRYERLVYKMMWNLKGRIDKGNIKGLSIDNYLSDVYEVFLKAMNNIKMEKIPNEKWTFYMGAWGYLNAYNRDTISHYIKKLKNETSLHTSLSDKDVIEEDLSLLNKVSAKEEYIEKYNPEEAYVKSLEKKVFWDAVNICLNSKFNKTQKRIWKERAKFVDNDKISISTLCEKLKISHKVYRNELSSMQNIFKSEMSALTNKYKF